MADSARLLAGGILSTPLMTASLAGEFPSNPDNSSKNSMDKGITGRIFKKSAPGTLWKWSREATFYQTLSKEAVMCGLCPHSCILEKGDRGVCRSRVNVDGKLYTLAYGNPCSLNTDPIEKKPLFHFKPGGKALSIAAAGCNFRCLNCQNWQISQVRPEDLRHDDFFPEQIVETALSKKTAAIAYTYSEPVTWYEYMFDTARLAKEKGISNLWISNGFIQPDPLNDLCKVIDAANVNLKSFDNATYRKLNGGLLDPVLGTFQTLHEKHVHFEMTTLVVPGYTDDPKMIKAMCRWILKTLGPDHPLHFLRFFPQYKLDRLPPTPISLLTELRELAMDAGIRYVYVGNVPGHTGNHTWCHQCGKLLIERNGYHLGTIHIETGRCRFCGAQIPGVWG